MKHFTSIHDVDDPKSLIQQTVDLKNNPVFSSIGNHKTIALIFFNPSLRTRMSTQKAAVNLGMNVIIMNINEDAWDIEFEDGTRMDGSTQEHIKDVVKVISSYCDMMGVRTFANLRDQSEDYEEKVLQKFIEYASVPVISLESATLHPLQSLTDMAIIASSGIKKPKIAVSWAPHPKALPQAVTNSFMQWVRTTEADVMLTHPPGYELSDEFTEGFYATHHQQEAFEGADFVYAKSWSSFSEYGATPNVDKNWTITPDKMALTNAGRFMHCLPIRRNVVASDEVIDNSLVYEQAQTREYAAQVVIQNLLQAL